MEIEEIVIDTDTFVGEAGCNVPVELEREVSQANGQVRGMNSMEELFKNR